MLHVATAHALRCTSHTALQVTRHVVWVTRCMRAVARCDTLHFMLRNVARRWRARCAAGMLRCSGWCGHGTWCMFYGVCCMPPGSSMCEYPFILFTEGK
jgi:hypothetical protein